MSAGVGLIGHKEGKRSSSEQLAKSKNSGNSCQTSSSRELSHRIALKEKGKVFFVDISEIVAVQAKRNYVVIHGTCGSHVLRQTMSEVEERLRPHGFIRIHRSCVVNSRSALEIEALPHGDYKLRVEGGNEYIISRTYKDNIRFLAGSWLGGQHVPRM